MVDYTKMTVAELRKEATKRQLKNRSKLTKKADLVRALQSTNKVSSPAKRASSPKKCPANKVRNTVTGGCRNKCIRGKQVINPKTGNCVAKAKSPAKRAKSPAKRAKSPAKRAKNPEYSPVLSKVKRAKCQPPMYLRDSKGRCLSKTQLSTYTGKAYSRTVDGSRVYREIDYVNGKKHGKELTFDVYGEKDMEVDWKNDVKQKEYKRWDDGEWYRVEL